MDAWVGGLAIDSDDFDAVTEALDDIYLNEGASPLPGSDSETSGDERVLLIRGTKGWTSIYPERSERDLELALELSRRLRCAVLAHRSILYDGFALIAFSEGAQIDEFQSDPQLFASFDSPELDEAGLESSRGDPEILAAAITGPAKRSFNPKALKDIYEKSRRNPGDEETDEQDPEMSISAALKALRKATGIGTFEHGFDDLWYGAEDLGLKCRFRAYKNPPDPYRGKIGKLRKRFDEARATWHGAVQGLRDRSAPLRDRLSALRAKKPSTQAEAQKDSAAGDDSDD